LFAGQGSAHKLRLIAAFRDDLRYGVSYLKRQISDIVKEGKWELREN